MCKQKTWRGLVNGKSRARDRVPFCLCVMPPSSLKILCWQGVINRLNMVSLSLSQGWSGTREATNRLLMWSACETETGRVHQCLPVETLSPTSGPWAGISERETERVFKPQKAGSSWLHLSPSSLSLTYLHTRSSLPLFSQVLGGRWGGKRKCCKKMRLSLSCEFCVRQPEREMLSSSSPCLRKTQEATDKKMTQIHTLLSLDTHDKE